MTTGMKFGYLLVALGWLAVIFIVYEISKPYHNAAYFYGVGQEVLKNFKDNYRLH